MSSHAGPSSHAAGKQPAGKGRKRDGPTGATTARASPCRRCLHNMAFWEVGDDIVACEDDEAGSDKCWRCRSNGKVCGHAVGMLKARGIRLAAAFAARPLDPDEIAAAQVPVKKALQALKNRKSMNPERVAAAQQEDVEEREERRTLAIESLVRNTNRMAESLETLVRHYETVHEEDINNAEDGDEDPINED